VIKGTNITANAIWSLYESGEHLSAIKILYSLSEKQINDVIGFVRKAA